MTDKQIILKRINSGMKCRKDCFVHSLITHNTCITVIGDNTPINGPIILNKTAHKFTLN